MKQLDRVSYSFGMKLNVGNYESVDFHVSLASDVEDGESFQEAMDAVKKEVEEYAKKTYTTLRESNKAPERKADTKDVPASAKLEEKKDKPRDPKILKKQIKSAFSLLESQKKITKEEFVSGYLNGQKVDNLSDQQTLTVIEALKANFKELSL